MGKIENNISNKANIYTFEGVDYDMQINMYVVSQFEDFNDVLNSMGKVETIFKMATAMMNGYIKKNKLDKPLLDADYIASNTSVEDFPKLTTILATALGMREKTEEEKELEALVNDTDDAPDIKN